MNNQQKATYAILADNAYWDVRKGYKVNDDLSKDFTNSNWTPVLDGWTVIHEVSGSGTSGQAKRPELEVRRVRSTYLDMA